jgi:hypothetical protein
MMGRWRSSVENVPRFDGTFKWFLVGVAGHMLTRSNDTPGSNKNRPREKRPISCEKAICSEGCTLQFSPHSGKQEWPEKLNRLLRSTVVGLLEMSETTPVGRPERI